MPETKHRGRHGLGFPTTGTALLAEGKTKSQREEKPVAAAQRRPARLSLPIRPRAQCGTAPAVQTGMDTHTRSSQRQQKWQPQRFTGAKWKSSPSLDSVGLASKQRKTLETKTSPRLIFAFPLLLSTKRLDYVIFCGTQEESFCEIARQTRLNLDVSTPPRIQRLGTGFKRMQARKVRKRLDEDLES